MHVVFRLAQVKIVLWCTDANATLLYTRMITAREKLLVAQELSECPFLQTKGKPKQCNTLGPHQKLLPLGGVSETNSNKIC